jgi:hypothetical protein
MIHKNVLLFSLFFLLISNVLAQKAVLQFSGIVTDATSGSVVPYCAIYIEKQYRGTLSNMEGFYSFVVAKGDTVTVRSLGYKSQKIVISSEIEGTSLFKDIKLERETYTLDEVVIYPLPSPHQLRQAFINLEVPDDLKDLAMQTLSNSQLDPYRNTLRYDGDENFDQYAKAQVASYYAQGQTRPQNIFNPFAWADFLSSWKRGDFRKK